MKRKKREQKLSEIHHAWLIDQLHAPLGIFAKRLGWSKAKISTVSSGKRALTKQELSQLQKKMPGLISFDRWRQINRRKLR